MSGTLFGSDVSIFVYTLEALSLNIGRRFNFRNQIPDSVHIRQLPQYPDCTAGSVTQQIHLFIPDGVLTLVRQRLHK